MEKIKRIVTGLIKRVKEYIKNMYQKIKGIVLVYVHASVPKRFRSHVERAMKNVMTPEEILGKLNKLAPMDDDKDAQAKIKELMTMLHDKGYQLIWQVATNTYTMRPID